MEKEEVKMLLTRLTTIDLWAEIGRRYRITFGKIQVAFHGGRPSEYVNIDERRVSDLAANPARGPLTIQKAFA